MLLPSIFAENLFDDFFAFPSFSDAERKLYGKNAVREMKTDVRESDDRYELDIDLPGFSKDDISLTLENGYMTVAAKKDLDRNESDKNGKVIRCERYSGALSRTFYVGEELTEEDISAKLSDGVLRLTVPKKEMKKLPAKRTIAIE
ncbi:MAG: Hsp20/alpha crystallin family protein [Clostridia bacterium]|nr:Hsp20/alpha crystallin family protein [Clostridia bacterium]